MRLVPVLAYFQQNAFFLTLLIDERILDFWAWPGHETVLPVGGPWWYESGLKIVSVSSGLQG